MKTSLSDIQDSLHQLLTLHTPPLQVRTHTDTNFEVAGTRATMQGKQQVDGIYFASVVPKPQDIRLYFFLFEYASHTLEQEIARRQEQATPFSKEEALAIFSQQVEIACLLKKMTNP